MKIESDQLKLNINSLIDDLDESTPLAIALKNMSTAADGLKMVLTVIEAIEKEEQKKLEIEICHIRKKDNEK